jgi:predicted aldo/keto reductase-like oxidoreductase
MIAKHAFGCTGHMSTRTLFGAAALGGVTQQEADRTLEVLLAYGVNHIDTAAGYGDSELRIGPWMDRYRQQFFLATKTGKRTYQEAQQGIRQSLERLRVDQIDLIQLHNLVDGADWEVAMGPQGALKAAIEAREQGLVRFIGVTGHGVVAPAMHKRSLERFDFDAVLLPFNYLMMQNPKYAADFDELVAICQTRQVAVQTIKSIACGPYEGPRTHTTWYNPLTDSDAINKVVHWVLGRPGIFLNTAGDIHLLPKVLDAASGFEATPADEEMRMVITQKAMEPLFV